jgi:hypothetical protein
VRAASAGFLVAIAAVLALAVSACGGTETTAATGGAGLVPAGVPAFLALDADPDSSQLKTLEQLAAKFPDEQSAVDRAKQALRKQGLDWEDDLKPALGSELDIVLLDLENGGRNAVGLIRPDDRKALERAIDHANAKSSGSSLVYDDFRGWTVLADRQALIDRFESMSDAAHETLDQDPVFVSAMRSTPDDALVKAYVDGREVMRKIDTAVGADQRTLVDTLGSLDWLALSLAAKQDGIALDTTVHGTPGQLFGTRAHAQPAFAPTLAGRVPGDALVYFTFHGTSGLLSGLDGNRLFKDRLGPLADVLGELGSLLEGENAFYVRPASGGGLPEVTLVSEPKPGLSGRATLDRILDRYSAKLGVRPVSGSVSGARTSTLRFGDTAVHYADVAGKLVVTNRPSGIAALKNPGTALSDNATFRETLTSAGMPPKTHGFLYVDVRAGTGLVEKLSGTKLPDAVSRNLKPLRSALEYAVSRQHQLSVRLFLQIK